MKECTLSPSIWYIKRKKSHTLHPIREGMEKGPNHGPDHPHLHSQSLREMETPQGSGRSLATNGMEGKIRKNPCRAMPKEMALHMGLGKTRAKTRKKHLGAILVPKLVLMQIMHTIPVPDGIGDSNISNMMRKPDQPRGHHQPKGVMKLKNPRGNPRSRGVRTHREQVLKIPASLLLPQIKRKMEK